MVGTLALALVALGTVACGSPGAFVWYTELPREERGGETSQYIIGPGDVISISVYEQDAVSMTGTVRTDGRIAMTFIGEVIAAGKAPLALAQEIEGRLKQFIVAPRVTVNVQSSRQITVYLMGEFGSKGSLALEPPAVMLSAMAQAGGLDDFADKDQIYVLRRVPRFQRIRFTYDAIMNNESGAALFPLRHGDVIYAR